MKYSMFIPEDVDDLYEKLKSEDLQGELSKENKVLIWKLPDYIIVKVMIHHIQNKGKISIVEGYIGISYLKNGREKALTHWHPALDEIYQDLMDINNGKMQWNRRKF